MPPVTCVLSAILGNRIFSALLADSVDRCVGPSRRLWFESKRYHQFPAPLWLRRFSAHESAWVARRWLSGYTFPGIVVVNGFTLALACSGEGMIVATDATPAFLARNGGSFASRMVKYALGVRFRRLVPRVSAWLPMSATVAQSLIGDYGVEPARCFVTRAPQPLIDPQSHARRATSSLSAMILNARAALSADGVQTQAVAGSSPGDRLKRSCSARPRVARWCSAHFRRHGPNAAGAALSAIGSARAAPHSDCYLLVVCEAAAQGVPSLATLSGRRRPADLPGKSSHCRSSTKPYGGRWDRLHSRNTVKIGWYAPRLPGPDAATRHLTRGCGLYTVSAGICHVAPPWVGMLGIL